MSKQVLAFTRSLIFRLIFWYSAILLVLFSAAFFVVYSYVAQDLRTRSSQELENEAEELVFIYQSESFDELKKELERQAKKIGTKNICQSVIDIDGKILYSTDLSRWKDLPIQLDMLPHINEPYITSLNISGFKYIVQVAYAKLAPDRFLRIALLLKKHDRILDNLQAALIITISITLLCVIVAGWVILRQAVGYVANVTKTALSISSGSLNNRVPVTGRNDELDNLAQAFNGMLDRIEQLVQELQEVTDNVAHDLKSPLTRIRIAAEGLLVSSKENSEPYQSASRIIEESDRLIEMINTTLEIRAIDTGIAAITPTQIEIIGIVKQVCELFEPLAEEKNIKLMTVCNENPGMIMGDARRLPRVFANLIDNAIKYTDSGGEVTVKIESDKDCVKVKIVDTGKGIASQSLDRIFERFYRTDQSRNMPGIGLGLSLAETIVKAHGGAITVESESGVGSTFTVILPRSQAEQDML